MQAHILVCFVTYAMWKTLGGWMQLSGLGDASRVLLDELKTIRSADVVLQTRVNGQPGPELVVRCVTQPDEGQEVLLNRLGLEIPNQIRAIAKSLLLYGAGSDVVGGASDNPVEGLIQTQH